MNNISLKHYNLNRFLTISFVIYFWILGLNFTHIFAEGKNNPEYIDKGDYYYTGGKKISLLRHKLCFAFRLKDDTMSKEAVSSLMRSKGFKLREAIKFYSKYRMYLCKIDDTRKMNHDDVINIINKIHNVEFTLPVFAFSKDNPMIMTDEFIVQFNANMTEANINTSNITNGVETVKKVNSLTNVYVLKVKNLKNRTTLDIANKYYKMNEVIWSHPNWIRRMEPRSMPNDTLFPNQWHLNNTGQNGGTPDADVDAPEAWDVTTGSDDITVAIIDEGIEIYHEDLNVGDKIVQGIDVVGNDFVPLPGIGENHGVSVAGVAAAAQNNGIGVSGMAPGCKLMAIRFLGGLVSILDEALVFVFAAQNGADVINNSWGPPDGAGQFPLPDMTKAAIDFAVNEGRGGKGCVILFASGNGNENVDNDGYAAYDNVIAVGASNDRDERAAYSDFGSTLDIIAPSSDNFRQGITTIDRMGTTGYSATNYTNTFNGTSASCPLASGVVALMLSANSDLTRKQVYDILINTTDKINPTDAQYDANGFSIKYGYGRINANRAVMASTSGGCSATCSIQLNGALPTAGIDICAQNLCNLKQIELKIWTEYEGQKLSIINAGINGNFKIPTGFNSCFRLLSPTKQPSGLTWGIRLVDPISGEELCADTVTIP